MRKSKHTNSAASPESVKRGYELKDVGVKGLIVSAIALAILSAVSMVIVVWLLGHFQAQKAKTEALRAQTVAPPATERRLPPGPRLQADEVPDMTALRNKEDGILTSLEWISKDDGRARIPIERAIEIVSAKVAQTGEMPYWPPRDPEAPVAPAAPVSEANVPAQQ